MFGIPFVLSFIAPYLGPFTWIKTIWSYLPTPIRILLILVLTALISSWYTNYRAEQRFKEIIRKSNENAVALDRKINGDAAENMKVKLAQIQEEKRIAENTLSQYAIEYQQMKDNCNVDDELYQKDKSINDGSIGNGLSKPVPNTRKATPIPHKRNTRPNNMPPNKGG